MVKVTLFKTIFRWGSALFIVSVLMAASVLATPAATAGYALRFDGTTDFVELPQSSEILGTGWVSSKSVSLWVKPTGIAPDCNATEPIGCDSIFGDKSRWWGIYRGFTMGVDRIWVLNFDGTGSGASSADWISLTYNRDEWVHITLVHDGVNLCAYKNGVLTGCTPSGSTGGSAGPPPEVTLTLGGVINNSSKNSTFEGEIDEVSIWDRPLPQGEIAANMYEVLSGTETGLRAYYRMSDGSGTTLTDDSPYDWNGILMDGDVDVPPNGSPAEWVLSNAFDGATITPTTTNTPSLTATSTVTRTSTPTNTRTLTPTTTMTPTRTPTSTTTSTATRTSTPTRTATSTPTPTRTLDPSIIARLWLPLIIRE